MGWYKATGSRWVTRHWPIVIIAWIVLAIVLRLTAPKWEDVAADGDLAYLPDSVPSLVGQRQLDAAFPGSRVRSQMTIILAVPQGKFEPGDTALSLDLARRLHAYAAAAQWAKLPLAKSDWRAENLTVGERNLVESVSDNLLQCLAIDDQLSDLEAVNEDYHLANLRDTYEMLSEVRKRQGDEKEYNRLRDLAKLISEQGATTLPVRLPPWAVSLTDVWTWRNDIVGHKLGSANHQARMIALHLDSEFTAVANIALAEGVEALIQSMKEEHADIISSDLQIEISGSAAIGADMLRAAASSVKQTEGVTILLVIVILALVYRGPFLVAIPLTSIALSLMVATNLLALLARDPDHPELGGLGIFTTTRIFIVVLLFGAGTDFCLFFLARCREVLERTRTSTRQHYYRAIGRAWRSVHHTIVASAMTTIVGLAMMWMSRFEKFRFSGPVIAISLAVTLTVCLTFTPAILCAIGRVAFWPSLRPARNGVEDTHNGFWNRAWMKLANLVVSKPMAALCVTMALLGVPAWYGWQCLGWVTYDFVEELSADAPSRRGLTLTRKYFDTNDSSPVTILLVREKPFATDEELRKASDKMADSLYLDGVNAVRSVNDPLGDYPPHRTMGFLNTDAWRRRVLKEHRISKDRYLSPVDAYHGRLAKFEVILSDNPFSLDATATLGRLAQTINTETDRIDSPWYKARFTTVGTTVGITDLRDVTQSDQSRIQILVTTGVWAVLLFLLRQFVLSTYLIFTVLFSYFSTLV